MKKNNITPIPQLICRTLIVVLILLQSCHLFSQTVKSGYFFRNIPERNQINAAFSNDFSYIGLPTLSNITVNSNSNGLSIKNLIFKNGNETVTLFHPSVSVAQIDKLKDVNTLGLSISNTLLSVGINHNSNVTTSFSISSKTVSDSYLPKSLFALLKKMEPGIYDLSDSRSNSYSYIDFSLGQSRKINENIRVGINFHFLGGLTHMNLGYDKLVVNLQDDLWKIDAIGKISSSFFGLENTAAEGSEIEEYIEGWTDQSFDFKGFSGAGFATDLGLEYSLSNTMRISFAANNLGFISWMSNRSAHGRISSTFEFSGFQFDTNDDENTFDNQLDKIGEDLKELYKIKKVNSESFMTKLIPELLLGFEKDILDGKISFGALISSRIYKSNTDYSFMLSTNLKPNSWFYAGANCSLTNNNEIVAGGIIGFSPKGFNFFLATDYIHFNNTKQLLPIDGINLNFKTGISITFGHLKKK